MAVPFSRITRMAAALLPLFAQAQDPYVFLKARDYPHAVLAFEASLQQKPQNVAMRKDYAYALLKIGGERERS